MTPCPCHSAKPYNNCCKPFHQGSLPGTAMELMRSRYAAYALSLADYIIKTTHPSNSSYTSDFKKWSQETSHFSQITEFISLEIIEFTDGEKKATVTFTAGLKQEGRNASFTEKSHFEKNDMGQWLYLSGEMN